MAIAEVGLRSLSTDADKKDDSKEVDIHSILQGMFVVFSQ